MAASPGRGSQIKGKAGERDVAKLLISWCEEAKLPVLGIKRNLMQSMEGGHDLNGVPGWSIEVKRQEAYNMKSWWEQTVKSAEALDAVPVLAWRQNHKKWCFRVRIRTVHHHKGHTENHLLDADLTLDQFKLYFLYHVWTHAQENKTETT